MRTALESGRYDVIDGTVKDPILSHVCHLHQSTTGMEIDFR
jgi:hypothetical protein